MKFVGQVRETQLQWTPSSGQLDEFCRGQPRLQSLYVIIVQNYHCSRREREMQGLQGLPGPCGGADRRRAASTQAVHSRLQQEKLHSRSERDQSRPPTRHNPTLATQTRLPANTLGALVARCQLATAVHGDLSGGEALFPSVAVLGKGAVAFVGVGGGQGSQQAISGLSPKEANAQLYSAPAAPTRLAVDSWIGDERDPFPCNFTGFLSSRPC